MSSQFGSSLFSVSFFSSTPSCVRGSSVSSSGSISSRNGLPSSSCLRCCCRSSNGMYSRSIAWYRRGIVRAVRRQPRGRGEAGFCEGGVHPGERLVQQHEFRLCDEGARDLEAPPLAPGQLEALLAPQVPDGELVEQALEPLRLRRVV